MKPTNKPTKIARGFLFATILLGSATYGFDATADCFSGTETIDGNWFVYDFRNDCDTRVKFSVDYCAPADYSDENSPPDCEVRTLILLDHTTLDFQNWARPLNPRNFRQ